MSEVIDFGAFSVKRKQRTYFGAEADCKHLKLELEEHGEIVRCIDCKAQVSAWWALTNLAYEWEKMLKGLKTRQREVDEAKAANIHLIAAKNVERAWRKRDTVPTCPHCDRGILPEDGFGFMGGGVSRAMELRRREVERDSKGTKS